MKKTISLILCAVIICLSFTACSGLNADMTEKNITATVEEVEKSLKSLDIDNLNKYVDSPTLSVILHYAAKHEQFANLGKAIFANLEMEVTKVDIENKTVTVSVSNKDLTKVANDFAKKLKDEYTNLQLFGKLNDEEFLDTELSDLCSKIDASGFMPEAIEITLNITQTGENLVLSFDTDAEDAVSGGALSSIKKIYSTK